MIVVGIAGRKGHGKDTIADVLVDKMGFRRVRFADPLKDMIRVLYDHAGLTREAAEARIEGPAKGDPCWALMGATPRWAMQSLGTEWRDALNPPMSTKLWSQIMLNKLATMPQDARIVVPDLRFPHELEALKRVNATTLRVVRPSRLLDNVDDHPSEKLVDTLAVDFEIKNTGTLEAFQAKALRKMEEVL